MSILEDVLYIHLVHQFWEFLSEKKGFPDLLIWWDIGKCKVKQITQEYCNYGTKRTSFIFVNPEMAALYDEKCKQLKGIIDDKLYSWSVPPC